MSNPFPVSVPVSVSVPEKTQDAGCRVLTATLSAGGEPVGSGGPCTLHPGGVEGRVNPVSVWEGGGRYLWTRCFISDRPRSDSAVMTTAEVPPAKAGTSASAA